MNTGIVLNLTVLHAFSFNSPKCTGEQPVKETLSLSTVVPPYSTYGGGR